MDSIKIKTVFMKENLRYHLHLSILASLLSVLLSFFVSAVKPPVSYMVYHNSIWHCGLVFQLEHDQIDEEISASEDNTFDFIPRHCSILRKVESFSL
jgi:hypothetical protein